MNLSSADFAAIENFPLASRWRADSRSVLTPAELSRIRPLTAPAAAAVTQFHQPFLDGQTLVPDLFTEVIEVPAHDVAGTTAWLRSEVPSAAGEDIFVSWDRSTAVLTDWSLFLSRWRHFCYPSSDDVSIGPPDARWLLLYRHFEIFVLGKRGAV